MGKVAYILDCFPAYSETFILREILALKHKGHRIMVLARMNTHDHPEYSKVIHPEAQELEKDVYFMPTPGTEMSRVMKGLLHIGFLLSNPARYLCAIRLAWRCNPQNFYVFKIAVFYAWKFRRAGVTHIHAHYAMESATYAMMISLVSGIPYSFTVHAHDIFLPEPSAVMTAKYAHAKFVACISEYNKKLVIEKFSRSDPAKFRVIHCGINTDRYAARRPNVHSIFRLISVGRLVEHKGFRYLIQACAALKERRDIEFSCRIIGDGEQREELLAAIAEYRLAEQVELMGAMDQASVAQALRDADVFVLPCVVERNGMQDGIPVALMEAMALELPVISTHVSGVPELVRDGAGELVMPEDLNGLVKAIERIYRMSENERQDMGRRGRGIVEREFNLVIESERLAAEFLN